MTVTYTPYVATATFPGFVRAMLIWKGSIWKLVYAELFIWCLLFLLFTLIYRFALNDDQQQTFEKVCLYCYNNVSFIPFEFIVGYYITLVISRWSVFWNALGFLDSICLTAATYLRYGDAVRAQIYRRNIVRLVLLFQVMVYRMVCRGVRKKFPTSQSLVDAGYLHADEVEQWVENKFWMPIKWSLYLVRQARKEGLIRNDFAVQKLYEYITNFRGTTIKLWLDDWVPVPLAYTQVAYLTIRIYFLVLVFAQQFVNTDRTTVRSQIDIYVPILTIIHFVLYVGWCKMGEALVNPFGDDDDDFDYNFVLTRNLNVGMDIVTGIESRQPALVDEDEPSESPKAVINAKHIDEAIGLGSIANMDVRRTSTAPVVMVKRSKVTALRQESEILGTKFSRSNSIVCAPNTVPFDPEALPVKRHHSVFEEGLWHWHRAKSHAGPSKHPETSRSFFTQSSCPSQLTDEHLSRILATLMEADESLQENRLDGEENDKSSKASKPKDNYSSRTPNHIITPSRQNSANSGVGHMPGNAKGHHSGTAVVNEKVAQTTSKEVSSLEKWKKRTASSCTARSISENTESNQSSTESYESNSDNILTIPVNSISK